MNRLIKLSLLLFLCLCCVSYSIGAQTNSLLVSYSKTRCMGKCPTFRFEIHKDGSAFYTGEENVSRIGKWFSDLSDAELEEIKSIFENGNFFSFKDRYYAEISDLPATYIEYRTDAKEKKVMDYYGAPPELKELELEVEAFIDQLNWVRQKVK